MKKKGRPRSDSPRTRRIPVLATPEDYERLKKAAGEARVSLSTFLLLRGLEAA